MNKLLLTFDRNGNLENSADFGEKLGNITLGLLRIGFGKTLTVEKISEGANQIKFTEKVYSTSVKVAAVALFIFAFPITIPLAGIGCVLAACSKSHNLIFNSYFHKSATHKVVLHKEAAHKAATTIQKYIRGYLARKAHLPSHLYAQYKVQCDKAIGSEMPQAKTGNTPVYLPQEMPEVVLKNSGREEAIKRFHQMQTVRAILNSQNSSHLVIPKANLYQNFLVEQRLPINVDSYHNMGLYLSQPESFNEAVRELTRLFSRVSINDLVTYGNRPLGNMPGAGGLVRYDNLPLYIIEENGKKVGKIGLIDLENLREKTKSKYGDLDLSDLVKIFPLHIDTIKDEASKLKMKVNNESLESYAMEGRKYLLVGYNAHLKWLKQKGVSTKTSYQPFQVSTQRLTELTTLLEKELLNLNEGINYLHEIINYRIRPPKDFLTKNPAETAKKLSATITPRIIENLNTTLEFCQKEKLKRIRTEEMTESQLVSLRSQIIWRPELYEAVPQLLSDTIVGIDDMDKNDIAEQLAYFIMVELVKGGDIFYFDPAYYTNSFNECWVRY